MKKIYVLFMSSLLLLSCAKDDVSKPSEWPEWPTPSKPKIENAVLRGVNGETVVAAGDKVKFTAQVSDEYNDLVSFQLLVTMDGAEILNLSKGLSGRSAVIEEEATLPFVAGFQNGRPVVTIKAVNDLGGNESTLTLDEAASVAVMIWEMCMKWTRRVRMKRIIVSGRVRRIWQGLATILKLPKR